MSIENEPPVFREKKIDDGGNVFPPSMAVTPCGDVHWSSQIGPDTQGMSLRDYFAAHCPDSWVTKNMPATVGDIRTALISRGIIPPSAMARDVLNSYGNFHEGKLIAAIRYDYADAMIAARKAGA